MESGKVINKVFQSVNRSSISFAEIVTSVGEKRKRISQALCRLIQLGYVERLEGAVYRLSDKGESLKTSEKEVKFTSGPTFGSYRKQNPSRNSLRSKVWRLMRLQRKFTINELMALGVDGGEKMPRNNISIYVNALKKAGYLYELNSREEGYALTSNGFKRYTLINDTGYKAPIFRREIKQIYDPNTGEVISW